MHGLWGFMNFNVSSNQAHVSDKSLPEADPQPQCKMGTATLVVQRCREVLRSEVQSP